MKKNRELRGEALAEALLKYKPDNLSEGKWAQAAGLNRGFFSDMRNKNTRPLIDNLNSLLVSAGKTMADIDDASPSAAVEVSPAQKPFRIGELPQDVPILGTAQGAKISFGQNGSAVEIEPITIEREPFGHVRRPPSCFNQPVYALYVAGESMMNRFRPGDLIYVDSRREPSVGDDVVVQLIEEPRSDADPAEVKSVLVKTLIRRTATHYELEQYNPEIIFRVDKRRVAAIHRVIPLKELMS